MLSEWVIAANVYAIRYVACGLNLKSQTHNNDFMDILNTYSTVISSV